jgi:hypothetical protein
METVDLLDWDTVEHCVEPVKYSHRLEELTMDNIPLPSSPPRLVRSKTVFLSNSSLDEMEEEEDDDEGPLTLDMLATPPRLERSKTVVMPTKSLEEEEDKDVVMVDTQSTPPPLTRNNCNPEYQDYKATEKDAHLMDMAPNIYRQNAVSHRVPSPTEARVKYSDEICYNK